MYKELKLKVGRYDLSPGGRMFKLCRYGFEALYNLEDQNQVIVCFSDEEPDDEPSTYHRIKAPSPDPWNELAPNTCRVTRNGNELYLSARRYLTELYGKGYRYVWFEFPEGV